MMRTLRVAGLTAALALPFLASAQQQYPNAPSARGESTLNHGEFAAYGDFFRVAPSGHSAINFVGLGGRAGFNLNPHLALEGEMSYDFERNYTVISNNNGTTTTIPSTVRPLTGLFGPKLQFGTSGPFRAFVTGKVGFAEFSTSHHAPSTGTFTTAVDEFGGSSTHFAVYPGAGFELFGGPLGLRAEVGDEIYFNNGTNHNLRVAIGPTIRF